MHTVEEAYRVASELYWIAFLLTGRKDTSLGVSVDALRSGKWGECLRSMVIHNALAAMQTEIAASARELASQTAEQEFNATAGWSVDPDMSRAEIDDALLGIDLFPRCAVLLTVFEGVTLEKAATLLQSGRDLVQTGRTKALRDLTRHLAKLTRKSDTATSLEGFFAF